MYQICTELDFSAAHEVPGHPGKCAGLHGHNYRVLIYLEGDRLDDLGMLVDFSQVKTVCRTVLETLDHQFLNELAQFREDPPTSENIARVIYDGVAGSLPATMAARVRVSCVTIYETPTSCVTYRPAR